MLSEVGFIETKGKTAEYISNMSLEKVNEHGIDIANHRGEAYDNAAVMPGKYNCVQKLIFAYQTRLGLTGRRHGDHRPRPRLAVKDVTSFT